MTAISSYAFIGNDSLRMVVVGKNVKRIRPYAFAGCKNLKTLKVKSRGLTAKKVSKCLKDSKIGTVKVLKNAHTRYRQYKKIFKNKATGASGKLSVKKQK